MPQCYISIVRVKFDVRVLSVQPRFITSFMPPLILDFDQRHKAGLRLINQYLTSFNTADNRCEVALDRLPAVKYLTHVQQ